MTAAMREAAALLPCPFCGHLPELEDGVIDQPWTVQCMNPDCLVRCAMDGADTRKQAAAAWNRRALPVPQADDLSKKPENLGTSDEHVKDVERVARAIIEAINPNRDFRLNPHHEDELSGWRRTARAAIAALPRDQIEADGWRPIETAPKDGRFMIGARFNGSEFLWAKDLQWLTTGDVADLDGYGEPDESTEPGWYHGDDEIVGATHWRPLPAPPVRHPDAGGDL